MHDYTYCGLDCHDCEYKEKCHCEGCKASNGEPFHGPCPLAKCAIDMGVEYCSLCKEFPCELLKSYSYDPTHGDNGNRIEVLIDLARETVH